MTELRISSSYCSFFTFAAWYSLVVPFAAAIAWFFYVAAHEVSNVSGAVWFYAELSGLVLGVVSLFGIRAHGCKRILWKAAIGIVASLFFGWFAAAMSSMSWPG